MMDDASKCAATVYVVEATGYEQLELWKEWHCFVRWEQDMCGYFEVIGQCARMPVSVSVFWYIINTKRVAFYEAVSQVVDYRMVDRWLTKTFPCLQNFEAGRRPHSDAMNFGSAMEVIWPHKIRPERALAEMNRRFRESLQEVG